MRQFYQALSFLLFIFGLLGFSKLHATHITGASLSYTCLGSCTYRIYHTTYYDCAGAITPLPPLTPPAPVINFNAGPGCNQPTAIGGWNLVSYVEVTPVCPGTPTRCTNPNAAIYGTLEALFYRDYNFCNVNCTTAFEVTYGTCCRNGVITSGAANDGIFLKGTRIDLGVSPCNNSPTFLQPGRASICAGRSTTVSVRASDPDGDSLLYSLVTCWDNPNSAVGYNSGYSPTAPLGPTWNVYLDGSTGDLSFTPNPGNLVVGVLCVKVEEFRNGVKIGEIVRDLQVQVENCGSLAGSGPVIDSVFNVTGGEITGSNRFRTCQGVPFSFTVSAHDADTADVLRAFGSLAQFPGATLTQQGNNPANFVFSWIPSQPANYTLALTVADSTCPWPLVSSANYRIEVGTLCLDASITDAQCGTNLGAIDLTVNGGSPPYSYSWNNGDTTQDLSGIVPGQYTVTVTDSGNHTWTRTFIVAGTNLNLSLSTTQPTCNAPSGSISTSINGGTAPYTYLWNTGDTTSTISGLAPGGYSVTVMDSTDCPSHKAVVLLPPDSCFNVIEGTVYQDLNGNCVQDANEPGLENYLVDLTPGGATLTDSSGHYSFLADTGNFTMHVYPWNYHTVLCPSPGLDSVRFDSLGNVSGGHNFAISIIPVQDLRAQYHMSAPRPGYSQWHGISVINDGSMPASGTLEWQYDSVFQYQSAYPVPVSHTATTRMATWQFSNLLPGQIYSVRTVTTIDTSVAIGVPFTQVVRALPVTGDTTPLNNVLAKTDTTRASYDPNDKLVSPVGLHSQGFIQPTENQMEYTIRFQNTGTDTAFFVVIRDTLDSDLDYTTIQPTGASHNYQLDIEADRVLVFRFDHINLPDSGRDLSGSQGYVGFRIQHKGRLAAGTEIRNRAAIYFDFNAPVITAEVLNTVYTQPVVSLGKDTALCAGQSLTANMAQAGMPPYDFTWSDGSTQTGNTSGQSTVNIQSGGLLKIQVTDAFGFTNEDSVQVTLLPAPDAAFTATPGTRNVAFVNTNAPVNNSWQWDFGDGEDTSGVSAVVHRYATPGLYTVTLVAGNSCGSDTTSTEVDLRTTSLDDATFGRSVRLAPNPFTETCLLSFSNPEGETYILQVFDLTGRVVKTCPSTRDDRFVIHRDGLAPGVYGFELKGRFVFSGRLVIR